MHYLSLEQAWAGLRRFFPSLSITEQRVAAVLYAALARGASVTLPALAEAAALEPGELAKILARWPGLYRDARGRITGYWGMSVLETPHCLVFGEHRVYAACAWDALFIPQVLGAAAEVHSRCAQTERPLALAVGPQGAAPLSGDAPVMSLMLPGIADTAAELARKLQRFAHFFATGVAARAWLERHPGAALMSLEDAWQLGRRRNQARAAAPYATTTRSTAPETPATSRAGSSRRPERAS